MTSTHSTPSDHSLATYRLLVVAAGAGFLCLLASQAGPGSVPAHWGAPLFFVALAVVSELWPLILPRYGAISLAEAVAYAVMALYGPLMTVTTAVAAGLSRFRRESRRQSVSPSFIAYSLSQTVLSYGVAACLYSRWAGDAIGVGNVALLALCVTVAFLIHSVIVAIHQWLDQERFGVWTSRINWQRLRLALQALMPLGVLMAVTTRVEPMALLLLMGPLAVTYLSIRNYTETLREAREVIEYLAQAVERRAPMAAGHSQRVAGYASAIARQLRLSEPMVRRVATAARLHDLGKISVGDQILCKAGGLQPEEWDKVRRYPEVGARVASQLSLSRDEAEYIRYHQEWFNGQGYPYRLQGAQIPVGARILAVAKTFDALTSPRAYKKAIPVSRAIQRMDEARGTQFDPEVLEALFDVLEARALRMESLPRLAHA